jgi:competence protein ComEC
VRTPKQWKKVTAKCRIRLPADLDLAEGDILTTSGKWQSIPDTGTRKSFARFLAVQGIYHEFRPGQNRLILLNKNKTGPDRIKKLRDQLLTILDTHFPSSDVRGLAKALLVGYRGELDRELSTAYSQTGVVHVIAISGLHLGLIYGLLILILRPFRHIPGFRLASGLFILFILWVFTLICGASPSVVRSAIMFSFLICGTIMHNKPVAGNMLSASAFVMLAAKPMVVYDIGFQLSYAAVGSLLLYNKSIQSLYTPANGILNMAWSSISTSLAAQILTTPFVLYHFHQFPLLFLLANLVAIPLSGIALLLLMLLCILALLSIPAEWVAGMVEWSIQAMNERIRALAALPFGRWETIPFTISSLVCCLLLIGTTTLYFQTKKGRALQATLGILIIWSLVIQYSSG